jgi:hypothetical protein
LICQEKYIDNLNFKIDLIDKETGVKAFWQREGRGSRQQYAPRARKQINAEGGRDLLSRLDMERMFR